MRLLSVVTFLSLLCFQVRSQAVEGNGFIITCTMRDTAANAFFPPAASVVNGSALQKTDFILDFSDEVPQAARLAMTFATEVWGAYLVSDVPIRVSVDWEDQGNDRMLASAGPGTLFRGFPGSRPNIWYPVALAENIVGMPLNDAGDADIRITANSTANWYFGTDGNTPRRQIDLASVILHELGHGLGFLSSVDTIGETELQIGFGGRFIIYDLFLETASGVPLSDESMFGNPSPELLRAVSRNDLFFDGPLAVREFGDEVPLFAPGTFDVGSSVSHLSESEFRPGTANALMTPFLSAGEAVHDPGPVTLGLFADMGWNVVFDLTDVTNAENAGVKLFPNPASDRITVELGDRETTHLLRLFSVDGRAVLSQPVLAGTPRVSLDIADLAPGLYVIVGEGTRPWRRILVVH